MTAIMPAGWFARRTIVAGAWVDVWEKHFGNEFWGCVSPAVRGNLRVGFTGAAWRAAQQIYQSPPMPGAGSAALLVAEAVRGKLVEARRNNFVVLAGDKHPRAAEFAAVAADEGA